MDSNGADSYALAKRLRTDSYLHLVAFAFLYYDHLLTFDAEIKFFWAYPNTTSSRLFFLNRYFSLVCSILLLLSIFFIPSDTSGCHPWELFDELFHATAQVIVIVLLTLRVYAIYGRDRRIIIVLSSLIFIGIGATAASLAFSKSTAITSPFPVGCHDVLDLRNSALVSVGWEALLIYDILLFSMTLLKAYQVRSEPTITEMGGLSLFTIIVRDGSIYFGLMTLTNLVNVFTFYITGESLLRGTFSAFSSCFSVTLMSRLMLHLHEIADKGLHVPYEDTLARPVHEHGSEPATLSTMDFHENPHSVQVQET